MPYNLKCPNEGCNKKFQGKHSLDKHVRIYCKHKPPSEVKFEVIVPREVKTVREPESRDGRPLLIHCGKQLIDPTDVSCVKEAKKGLFIVKLKSEPNPEWPLWVEEEDIEALMAYFEVKE